MNKLLEALGGGLLLISSTLQGACTPAPEGARAERSPIPDTGRTLADVLRAAGPHDPVPVIVTLADAEEVAATTGGDKHARRAELVRRLQARADRTQGAVRERLLAGGATGVRPLWVVNGVAATVSAALASEMMRFPGVLRVTLDATLTAPVTAAATASGPEWNLTAIHAPMAWSLGYRGAGAVVASLDTGVDLGHPDLKSRWRGGADSWYDPYRGTAAPYDALGHGTQTMGIMVGGAAGGTAIGVAPDARWIAAKIYDDTGTTTVSVIHQAFQWLLAPSGVPGAPDAPDVVNASWGLSVVNGCDDTFASDFEALRAAGIVVVFAAGNSGPSPLTSISPANDVDGFSAGAVDSAGKVASFSSRGPSACTGATFPDLVAPGVSVKTSAPSLGGVAQYTYVSGTSFSAPHVAGVAALLAGAFPAAPAADLEWTLRTTAGDLGPAGPDSAYGYGLVDAYAASAALAAPRSLGVATTALPDAVLGAACSEALLASGGVAPYTWSVTAGALPAGLGLAAGTGAITGAPTTPGTSGFTVQLEDAAGSTATRALSLDVVVAPLSLLAVSMRSGHAGAPYAQALTASGGVRPWTWSVAAGALPPGLVLGAATGVVSGTPTTKGAFPFTAQVQDVAGALATRALSIVIQ